MSEALDDELFRPDVDSPEEPCFPRRPEHYLDDGAESGWLRRFHPLGSDEVHDAVAGRAEPDHVGRNSREPGRRG